MCPNIAVIFYAEAASCLERAVNIFCEIGRLNMAARYYKVFSFEHELNNTYIEHAFLVHVSLCIYVGSTGYVFLHYIVVILVRIIFSVNSLY